MHFVQAYGYGMHVSYVIIIYQQDSVQPPLQLTVAWWCAHQWPVRTPSQPTLRKGYAALYVVRHELSSLSP